MNDVVQFLTQNSLVYLATADEKNEPKVRPFQFMLSNDGKLYFCTSNQKEVFKQLKSNASVEFSVSDDTYTWIRVSGTVVFDDNLSIKKQIIDENPLVKSIYHSADNPAFEIFYLQNGSARIYDFSGNPPKEFHF